MPGALIESVVTLVVAGLILWIIQQFPIDVVITKIIRVVIIVVVCVVVCIWLLYFLVGFLSGPGSLFRYR